MKAALALLACVALAGCGGHEQDAKNGVVQTQLPGDITSGGHTSGEVMAANTPGGAVQPGPSGTPGIPGGAEGNTGGTKMGGTAPQQTNVAATTTAPTGAASAPVASASAAAGPASAPGAGSGPPASMAVAAAPGASATAASGAAPAASAPLSPASAAALEAQRAQLALERVQDVVAARWHARAAKMGYDSQAAPPAAGGAASAPSAPLVVKSEKLGTAPPSPDVKTATKPATRPVVDRKAPDQAGPKP
jgi:hypothetical protein